MYPDLYAGEPPRERARRLRAWGFRMLPVLAIMAGGVSLQADVSPLLDQDFQADTAGQRPANTTQFAVYSRPSGADTATSQVKVIDGSPDVYGPFRRRGNLSLNMLALTPSDAPSFFVRNQLASGVIATNDGRFSVRVFIEEPTAGTAPCRACSRTPSA